MRIARRVKLALAALTLALAALAPFVAHAGRVCEVVPATVYEVHRALELATRTAKRLESTGAKVVIIARAGQDLSRYGLRYSHLGFAYQELVSHGADFLWRVVHKLNHCGSNQSAIYRQGLAEFFSEQPYEYRAGIMLIAPHAEAPLHAVLRSDANVVRLHTPHYSMVAYPWATRYQQSNQWAIETLGYALAPGVSNREAAQAWLRFKGYRPSELRIGAFERLGGRISSANIEFDDHPNGLRFTGRIRTVTVDSVFDWLQASGLGSELIEVH